MNTRKKSKSYNKSKKIDDNIIYNEIKNYIIENRLSPNNAICKYIKQYLQFKLITIISLSNHDFDITIIDIVNEQNNEIKKKLIDKKQFTYYDSSLGFRDDEFYDIINGLIINIIYFDNIYIIETFTPLLKKYSKQKILEIIKKNNIFKQTIFVLDYSINIFLFDYYSKDLLYKYYKNNKTDIIKYFENTKNIKGGFNLYHYVKEKTINVDKPKMLEDLNKLICNNENKITFYKLFLFSYGDSIETFIFYDIKKICDVIIIDNIDKYLNNINDEKYKKNVLKYLRFLALNKQSHFFITDNYMEKIYGNYDVHGYFIKLLKYVKYFYVYLHNKQAH
jgi:hypothetical protein